MMSTFFLGGWLKLSLIYAVLSLDQCAWGQGLVVSRPLVVAPLMGWLLGNPALGLLVGVIAELLWVRVIPVGEWPMDTAIIGGLAIVWSLCSIKPGLESLVISLMLSVPVGILSRYGDIWVRRQNRWFNYWVSKNLVAGRESILTKALGVSLLIWFVKNFVFYFVMVIVGTALVNVALSHCPATVLRGLKLAGLAIPILAFTAVLAYFLKREKNLFSWTIPFLRQ
ncbi:MAG TPA: PTS sugar transporter subunit IIC [Elusimicrobiota bacterium]|nr:PTS sugar transporter subunit IIC [Elusimicrobiota bacterium]